MFSKGFFNVKKPFYNEEGLKQWKNGNQLYKTVGAKGKSVSAVDYVLQLDEKVVGHIVILTPTEEGVEYFEVRYPSFIEPIHISFEPEYEGDGFFFYGDYITFSSPPKRQVIMCDPGIWYYFYSVITSFTSKKEEV